MATSDEAAIRIESSWPVLMDSLVPVCATRVTDGGAAKERASQCFADVGVVVGAGKDGMLRLVLVLSLLLPAAFLLRRVTIMTSTKGGTAIARPKGVRPPVSSNGSGVRRGREEEQRSRAVGALSSSL